MKKDSQNIEVAPGKRRQRRGGKNFTSSKQRRQRDQKKREGTCAVDEQRSLWSVGCEIWALHLEPIEEDATVKALDKSNLKGLVAKEMEVEQDEEGSRHTRSQSYQS